MQVLEKTLHGLIQSGHVAVVETSFALHLAMPWLLVMFITNSVAINGGWCDEPNSYSTYFICKGLMSNG